MIKPATTEDWREALARARADATYWEQIAKRGPVVPAPPGGWHLRNNALTQLIERVDGLPSTPERLCGTDSRDWPELQTALVCLGLVRACLAPDVTEDTEAERLTPSGAVVVVDSLTRLVRALYSLTGVDVTAGRDLLEELTEAQRERDSERETVADLERQIDGLQSDLRDVRDELKDAQRTIEEHEETISDLRRDLESMTEERDNAIEERDTATRDAVDFEQQCEALKAELARTRGGW